MQTKYDIDHKRDSRRPVDTRIEGPNEDTFLDMKIYGVMSHLKNYV